MTHADLEVLVDIKQDNITESAIWRDTVTGEGEIAMCIRVDLTLPSGTSVTFHEQKLYVSVGRTI